jgi:hypothetical protein
MARIARLSGAWTWQVKHGIPATSSSFGADAMSTEHGTEPTSQLVLQRIRNRIIEYLELVSSFDDQREYQSGAPVHVPHEVINQWEDWVRGPRDPAFVQPLFTEEEQDAIARYHQIWNETAASTPNPLPDLESLFLTTEWQRLRDAAFEALRVFRVRGKLSEDNEVLARE